MLRISKLRGPPVKIKTRWAVPHVSVGVRAGSLNPAALHNKQTQRLLGLAHICSKSGKSHVLLRKHGELTIDEDDLDHGEGEERHGIHFHFDEHRREHEDDQDDGQTARDPQLLRDPETQPEHLRIIL